jgi:hypothetical protein
MEMLKIMVHEKDREAGLPPRTVYVVLDPLAQADFVIRALGNLERERERERDESINLIMKRKY